MRWARETGLVADAVGERRLSAMRLELLAEGALPGRGRADVELTTQWAALICLVDDRVDRLGAGACPGEVERLTAALRRVVTRGGLPAGPVAAQAVVLGQLWERTAEGMPAAWRERFTADYVDFLDATDQEVALRRTGKQLSLDQYVSLRRRTITLLPMLDILERTGDAPLVRDPAADSRVRDLRWAVADVAGWANDLASAADDAAVGQENLVVVLAREFGCPHDAARLRAAAMIEERRSGLRATAVALRTAPGLAFERSPALCRYVELVETFMAATLRWLAATGRFAPPQATPLISDL
jgi:hypothetical protein